MDKIEEAECKRLVAERDELRDLLSEFGARLAGWDSPPGESVSAMLQDRRGDGYWGESLTFNSIEWGWIKPLLIELRDRRKTAPQYIRFSSKAHPRQDA